MPRKKDTTSCRAPTISDGRLKKKNKYDNININQWKRNLIVYTTRIDEMNIWKKDIDQSNPFSFIEGIIKENMPIYIPKADLQYQPKRSNLKSIAVLNYKIDSYNTKVKMKNTLQSNLTTLESSNNRKSQSKITNSTQSLKSIKSKDIPAPSSTINLNRIINCRSTFLILRHGQSLETDVYFFNDFGDIAQHLKTEQSNCKDLKKYFDYASAVKIDLCCWYRRIYCVFVSSLGNNATIYLKKPHKCIMIGECKCCCKKYYPSAAAHTISRTKTDLNLCLGSTDTVVFTEESGATVITDNTTATVMTPSYDKGVQKSQKASNSSNQFHNTSINKGQSEKEWLRNLFPNETGISTLGSVIEKYFECNPLKTFIKKYPSCDLHFLKCAFIRINNVKNNKYRQHYNEYEHYKIGAKGEIEEYYRAIFKDSETNENQISNSSNEKGYDTITADVCCWYARKSFIDKLRLKKLSPNSLKFIMSFHNCSQIECSCCCRILTQPINNFKTSIDLGMPEHLLQTSDKVGKGMSLKIIFPAKLKPHNKRLADCTSVPEISVQDIIKLETNNMRESHIDNPAPILGHEASDINMLVSTIIQRFKGIQLSINEEGKIIAKLNVSESTLTSEELDILVKILKKVQKEVNSMGIQAANAQLRLPECSQSTSEQAKPGQSNSVTKPRVYKKAVNVKSANTPNQQNVITIDDDETPKNITPNITTKYKRVDNITQTKYFSNLFCKKREYYLEAFDVFLRDEQRNFNPTIENVISLGANNDIGSLKRKAMNEKTNIKKSKNICSPSNSNPPKSENNVLSVTKRNEPKKYSRANILKKTTIQSARPKAETINIESENKTLYQLVPKHSFEVPSGNTLVPVNKECSQIDDPIKTVSAPMLQNMLTAPQGPMRENGNELPTTMHSPDIPGSFNAVRANDPLIVTLVYPATCPKEEPIEEDSILGV